ncbi:MarR family winged helix-turn-helix transcriptional regulator [Nonomuraea africana]|uniref:DNA-binding MarR family transcriptional regulator n=1 Tax=Nonomuraea africana TaxID=46171 RepID=A0ABR9KPD6_9ACTN|nr:MarR family transcriptional regulator [Nonomuraea africana]MBE1563894.1 DNA-binding MarR family transcriptional regulator [Nonomuraea africana]
MAGKHPEDVFREFLIAALLHNEAVADQLGLQPVDVAAAILLEMRGPLAVGAISEELALPSASTTRLIDRLEKAGYVRRVRGERDRRMVTVELVEGGLEDYYAACEASRRHLDAVGVHYGPEQVPLLLEMFTRVAEAYRSATKELREGTT